MIETALTPTYPSFSFLHASALPPGLPSVVVATRVTTMTAANKGGGNNNIIEGPFTQPSTTPAGGVEEWKREREKTSAASLF